MATQARVAGTVKIDGVAAARDVIVIKDDPAGRQVVADGQSASDGTFDITYNDWAGSVVVLALDEYGDEFTTGTALNMGQVVHPATPNGYVYKVTAAGTTGTEEPTWPTTGSVQSGGVTFAAQPYYRPVASGPLQGKIVAAGDPYWQDVAALLHFEDDDGSAEFTDIVGHSAIGVGSAAVSYSRSRFGLGSARLDGGDNDYIEMDSPDFVIGPLDFTLELFIFWEGGKFSSIDFRDGVDPSDRIQIYSNSSGDVHLWVNRNNKISAPAGTLETGVWHHLALCRADGVSRLFVDGEQVGQSYIDTTDYESGLLWVGGNTNGSGWGMQGNVDEFRLTIGVGRYEASFAPPENPFPYQ